jgi:putative transposase
MKNEGKIVEKNLKEIEQHFKTIQIHEYIIMPNHIHFILANNPVGAGLDLPAETKTKERIIANNPAKTKITDVIGLFKSGVSRKIGYSIWQRNYYEHIIRNEKEYWKIKKYIIDNPVNWERDKYF